MNKWNMVKLEDVCSSIVRGPFGSALKKEFFVEKSEDTYKVYEQKHAIKKNVNIGSYYINKQKFDELKRFSVKPKDIIISCSGTIGEIYQLPQNCEKGVINQALLKLTLNNQIDSRFFVHYWRTVIKSLSSRGSSIKNISSVKYIREMRLPLPPLEVQKHIADTLDLTQEIINTCHKHLEELDKLINSVFDEMFGDPIINKKKLKIVELGEVCEVERGGSPRPINDFITTSHDGINWIKIGDAEEGSIYISNTKQKIKPEGMKKSRFVKAGDFLLSNSMSYGRPYILKIDGCIHDGWLVLRDKNNYFNKEYLFYALSSSSTKSQFKKMAVGGVVNNLNSTIVKSVRFFLPSIEMQTRFGDTVNLVEEQKTIVKESLKESQNLFNSLMNKYFD